MKYINYMFVNQPQGLTKEKTPQGYGSLHFNEEYSERREKAQKHALNEEYNQYLTKVYISCVLFSYTKQPTLNQSINQS